MAANPLIALQTRTPDVGAAFSNALLNLGRINQLQQSREEQPLRARILEAQAQTGEAAVPTATEQRLKSVVNAAVQLNTLPQEDRLAFAQNRRADLIADGQRSGQPVNTEDTDLFISKMESGDFTGAQSLIDNSIQAGQQLGIIQPSTAATGLASAKTEILSTGATIQALPNKEVEVRNPIGQLVTGQERLDILQDAETERQRRQQSKADITVETTRRVEQVKDATETANKAFGLVDNTRRNIENLRQVIPLVGQGANTGPITSLFPSFKAATIKLEQQQKRLGLDVVGAVTFGALSKGELDLAQAVALPLNLEGDDLIQWTNEKIAAQEKLANYYEEQAIFLSQGNTQADWLKKQRADLKQALGGATESDIRQTMKDNNMTRPQVIQELKRRNTGG